MAAGVYAITNIETNKVYIGSTIDFEGRWHAHRRDLRHNNHGNPHLQSSWSKYGENAFEFGVLEYLDNLDELAKVEQFWMDIYREEDKELYNIALTTGCPMLGLKHSEEAKRKIGEAGKGRIVSKETRHKNSEAQKARWAKSKALGFKRGKLS